MTPFDLFETQSVNPVDVPAESAVVAPAQSTGSGGGSAPLYEYQRLSRIGLLYWFCSRNFFRLFSRLAFVFLFLWLCFFGGIQTLLQLYLKQASSMHRRNTVASPSPPDTPPSDASPSLPDTPPSEASPSLPGTPPQSEASPCPPDTPPQSVSDFDYLVFLSPDFAIFNGGDYVQPGQSFIESHYLGGVHVSEFNHRNGFISLSDGRVIRLRRH